MVRFKTWKDNYIFLRDYCNCSCLNCIYGGTKYTDDSETHSNIDYIHIFCMESLLMMRLDVRFVCAKWRHQNTGKCLEDYNNEDMWNLTDEVIDILDKDYREWSIDEVKELISDEVN